MDDEKKQVLQLFGQRSGDITRCQNYILCDLPNDLENPALLVTGACLTVWLILLIVVVIKDQLSPKNQFYTDVYNML